MKILGSNLKIFIFTVISIILGVFLWNKITLPYSNPHNVYGVLSIEKYNPFNNDLRFIIFFFLVFGTFTLSLICFKKNLNTFKEIIFFKKRENDYKSYNYLNLVFVIFFIFITFEFLSMSYPLNEIDFFHEGERLGPAKNYLINGKIWSGSLFNHGAFIDVFQPIIAWKIFGKETIGAYRLFLLILIFFTKLFFLVLILKISKLIQSDEITKIVYFTLIALTVMKLSEYMLGNSGRYISHRELPILFFLIFSMEIVLKKNKNFYGFFIGLLSSSSIIFLVDRGIYVNVMIIFLLSYFLLRKEFKTTTFIFSGSVLSWIILYFLIGSNEFDFFLKDTYHYLSIKGFLDSYIYPAPFIAGKFFSTKGIIIITLAGLLTIYSLFVKNEKQDNSLAFYFFIIFLFSLLTYKNALGRVDPDHVRYSMSFSIILIFLIFWKKISFKIGEKLNSYKVNIKLVASFSAILFLSFLIINSSFLKGKHSPKTFDNLVNLKYRIKQYIELSDKIFVQPKLLPVIDYYKKISAEDNCVQAITNEAAWPYLVKKQMCTKHYIIWYAASDKLQKDFVSEFSSSNAKYLLVDAPFSYGGAGKLWIDGIDYEKRHALIYKYLDENFKFHKNIDGWIFYKKNIK